MGDSLKDEVEKLSSNIEQFVSIYVSEQKEKVILAGRLSALETKVAVMSGALIVIYVSVIGAIVAYIAGGR